MHDTLWQIPAINYTIRGGKNVLRYKTYTEMTDFGPYITKLILELPERVRAGELTDTTFHVYAECREADGSVVIRTERKSGRKALLKGYPKVLRAYPCTSDGVRCAAGDFAAIDLQEEYLNKRVAGDLLASRWLENFYRITQMHDIPGPLDGNAVNGLVYDTCAGDICPQLSGWKDSVSVHPEHPLHYGYFTPAADGRSPLVVWFHGAGEGGDDIRVAYTGNKVTAISSPDIQGKLGGAAWVLVPQCPTVWMDDGIEKLGRSNRSIYTEPVKRLIDQFISQHKNQIDENRIYIGGLSNGGFMTIRMLIDYPDFFAGAIAACAAFYQENITGDVLQNLKKVPLWFVHCKKDTIVPPIETSVPLYRKLKEDGAEQVHFTLFDRILDLSGKYKEPDGQPKESFGHGVWIHVYNDDCAAELDNTRVMDHGIPVTLWEWLGCQSKEQEGPFAISETASPL